LKELLFRQILNNIKAHKKRYKNNKWEENNAFISYVSGYQDEELYEIIEDPKGIVIDVFHAVLITAVRRELISQEDFLSYFKNAKTVAKTDKELWMEELESYLINSDSAKEIESEVDLEAEKEKYWKCPSCNQMVAMEFGICWNCQTEIPEVIEHPDKQDVIKELAVKKTFNPFKTGLMLIGAGILVAILEQFRGHSSFFNFRFDYVGIIFGSIFAMIGIAMIVYGMIDNSWKDTR